MKIVIDNKLGEFTLEHIKRYFLAPNENVFCTRVGNKFFAIKVPNSIKHPDPVIVYDETTKNPIWKQQMDFAMGKKPSATQSTRRGVTIKWLNEDQISPMTKFTVYRFVSM